MLIHLTNKENSQSVNFIDTAKKDLKVLSAFFPKNQGSIEEIELVISYYSNEKQKSTFQALDKLTFIEGKKSIANESVEYYVNKKFKIPKQCERIVFSINLERAFQMDCRVILE